MAKNLQHPPKGYWLSGSSPKPKVFNCTGGYVKSPENLMFQVVSKHSMDQARYLLLRSMCAVVAISFQLIGPVGIAVADQVGVWNGYLSQINVVECSNLSNEVDTVKLLISSAQGKLIAEPTFELRPKSTKHIILNPFGINNQYGTYRIQSQQGNFFCHTAFYRHQNDLNGNLEFAFSISTLRPLQGTNSGIFNSMNPDGLATQPVANWLSVINTSDSSFSATVLVYNLSGDLQQQKTHSIKQLSPGARLDLPLGHPEGQSLGLYRIVPDSHSQNYNAFLSRYSGTSSGYVFAFPLLAQSPSCEDRTLPISTMGPAINWGEIANPNSSTTKVRVEITGQDGTTHYNKLLVINPFSQVHIPINTYLGETKTGSLHVRCDGTEGSEGFLAQSLFYGYSPQSLRVVWAYASQNLQSAVSSQESIFTPVNTYLRAANWQKIIGDIAQSSDLTWSLHRSNGGLNLQGQLSIPAKGSFDLDIHSLLGNSQIGGLVTTPATNDILKSESLRVFYSDTGQISKIMNVTGRVFENQAQSSSSSSSSTSSSSSSSSSSTSSSSSSSSSNSSSSSSTSSSSSSSSSTSHPPPPSCTGDCLRYVDNSLSADCIGLYNPEKPTARCDGSGSNTAFTTIQRAINATPNGGYVRIRGNSSAYLLPDTDGSYVVFNNRSGIVLEGYSDETVRICGNRVPPDATGQALRNSLCGSSPVLPGDVIEDLITVMPSSNYITIRRIETAYASGTSNHNGYAIRIRGSYNTVHHIRSHRSNGTEIHVMPGTDIPAEYNVIAFNELHNTCKSGAIKMQPRVHRNLIHNNLIYRGGRLDDGTNCQQGTINDPDGVILVHGNCRNNFNCSYNEIKDNVVLDMVQDGFDLSASRNVIKRNIVINAQNGIKQFKHAPGTAEQYWDIYYIQNFVSHISQTGLMNMGGENGIAFRNLANAAKTPIQIQSGVGIAAIGNVATNFQEPFDLDLANLSIEEKLLHIRAQVLERFQPLNDESENSAALSYLNHRTGEVETIVHNGAGYENGPFESLSGTIRCGAYDGVCPIDCTYEEDDDPDCALLGPGSALLHQ